MEKKMNKALVVYFSIYGSAKKYAEWISEELGADIFSIENAKQLELSKYTTIILGCSLYPETSKNIKAFVDKLVASKEKKIIVFSCGSANVKKSENTINITKRFEKLFPIDVFENVKMFYLRGNLDYSLMSMKHKIMMGMMKKMVSKKKEKDEDDILLLETYGKKIDFTDKSTIKDLIDYCKK